MKKPKLYVGCALNNAPLAFQKKVDALKKSLVETFEILEFIGSGEMSDGETVLHDLKQVERCDLMLGIADLASTGLGSELTHAGWLKRPTLIVAQAGAQVSRFVPGLPAKFESLVFQRYETWNDIEKLISDFAAEREIRF